MDRPLEEVVHRMAVIVWVLLLSVPPKAVGFYEKRHAFRYFVFR